MRIVLQAAACVSMPLRIMSSRFVLLCISAALWQLCLAGASEGEEGSGEKIPLHFSYITAMTGGFVASGGIPAVDLALEQINNRTDILPNYTLNYTTILDSKVITNCSATDAKA